MYVRSVILFTFLATAGSLLARPDKPADTLDLSTADFSKGNIIDVEGPWEFYWKRFIEPEEARSHPKKESDAVVSGSIAWTDLSVHGEQLGSDGFATYRLKVRLPKDCPQLGLSIAHQFSSYRLFVDHREMARSGMPGTTSESTMHSRKDNTVFFQPTSQDLEIMFHVANFYNYRGGLTGGIQLGSSESIQSTRYRLLAFDLFMIGFVFSIWLYHLFIFVQRPGEKSILFYLVLSGSFLPRMMLLDQKVIFLLVDSVPLNVHIKVLHGLNAITPTLIALFVRSVLPSMVSRRIVILFFLASLPYYATWFLAPQVQTRAVFFYLFLCHGHRGPANWANHDRWDPVWNAQRHPSELRHSDVYSDSHACDHFNLPRLPTWVPRNDRICHISFLPGPDACHRVQREDPAEPPDVGKTARKRGGSGAATEGTGVESA
jgi:hypothetical protein